ncbi:MAG: CDP-diacylglycerol--glycerol-3-phosphate 3-phosphatidyltransferase [Pseudonocardiaceae bacterium]|nr:CDP-diacylglycerol--glycerol-3-phosphate 3-phosphatidyltransferase [Pseudonocardiaceae bacterium]
MTPPSRDSPAQVGEVPLWNLANMLTMSRLAMVPLFLLALLVDDGTDPFWRMVAALLFLIASMTDRLDGDLARRRGQVTDFGKVADPIADKALTGSALVGLSALGELPWWVTLLIAGRELGVTALRFWVLRHGVIPASHGGKIKTFAQGIAIVLYVLPFGATADPVLWSAMGIAVALTVITGVDYLVRALRLRATARRILVTS